MLPIKYRPVMVPQWKRRRNMHVPVSGVIDDPCSSFDQPHNDPFDGSARFFAPQIEPTNQMKQVVCKKAHFQPGFVSCELMTARLIPAERILALFNPVFNIAPSVVNFDHRACLNPGIGHDEIIPWKKFGTMPLDFGDHSPGFVPAFSLILPGLQNLFLPQSFYRPYLILLEYYHYRAKI